MQFVLILIFLVSSGGYACAHLSKKEQPDEVPEGSIEMVAPDEEKLTRRKLLREHDLKIQRCLRRIQKSLNHEVRLLVHFGFDGSLLGEPDVIRPIDTDEFRSDVAKTVKRLRDCGPFNLPPLDQGAYSYHQRVLVSPIKKRDIPPKDTPGDASNDGVVPPDIKQPVAPEAGSPLLDGKR